jgi:hypothetical protein
MLSITLNSFVHRVPDKSVVLALAAQHGCQLKRIRRSRHWSLSGEEKQLRSLMAHFDDEAHQWIVKAITLVLPKPTVSLAELLEKAPSMTVNQLVVAADCSLTEARQAIDEHEGF